MITLKRLYLYGVLGISLVPLLLGLASLLQLILEPLAELAGGPALAGSRLARDELSRGLALVVVAAPIATLHAWLLRRSMLASPMAEVEERASDARSTYFFVVLAVTVAVAGWNLFEAFDGLVRRVLLGHQAWDLPASLAGLVIAGSAWLVHIRVRAEDLRAVPARTADDWLTRLYLYGALFIILVLGLVAAGNVLTIVARELLGLTPAWQSSDWWKRDLAGPLAGAGVAALGWAITWLLAARLLRAPSPMGDAHRRSRARSGYFLSVVLLCATIVLLTGALGLRHLFAALLGVWASSEGSRLLEDAGGPLIMAVPFLVAWWWHIRRGAAEARAFSGPEHGRAMVRAARYAVAFVGLAGLAVGLAWGIRALLDLLSVEMARGVVSAALLRHDAAPAVALALLGLCLWAPAWRLAQRERAAATVEVAGTAARRTYLILVSGLALVAAMVALAFLVYQLVRFLLEAGRLDDTAWAIATLSVASVLLLYHLLKLRSDTQLLAAAPIPGPPAEPSAIVAAVAAEGGDAGPAFAGAVERASEIVELSGPAGADLQAVNDAIRSRLPEGFSLRVVTPSGDRSPAARPG
jgi:hypothetical protein